MKAPRLEAAATLARGTRVLVIGDVMLDRYTHGTVHRISPEAPVPVVLRCSESSAPGGAGNAAANVAALGSSATIVAPIGADSDGDDLCLGMELAGVNVSRLVKADARTAVKHRVVASGQQIVRIDTEDDSMLADEDVSRLVEAFIESLRDTDVVLVSDYGKGVCSPFLCRRVFEEASLAGKPVVVDPKASDFSRYAGACVITPNLQEARRAAPDNESTVDGIGRFLRRITGASVVITRGAEGMTLFGSDDTNSHLDAKALHVFDVTGAGDTVAAVIAVGIGQGMSLRQCCVLANEAAAISVSRPGTTAVTYTELLAAVEIGVL